MGNFDVDLDFGKVYEEKIRDLFEGEGSIEVKTERDIWADTGNMAIEIRYKGKPSGISHTEADWFIYWYRDLSFNNLWMIKVDDLKSLSMTGMIPMLVNAVQELSAKVPALEAQI